MAEQSQIYVGVAGYFGKPDHKGKVGVFRRAALTSPGAMSTPSTVAPFFASARATRPSPQPASSQRVPRTVPSASSSARSRKPDRCGSRSTQRTHACAFAPQSFSAGPFP